MNIDPDIRRARTLPASWYRDPEIHAAVMERVFARSWQFVGDAGDPADVRPVALGDEPLLITRDEAGTLRCLSNVCTHRGNLLATEPCDATHLRCRYHGRRFALDGTFEHMPEFEEAEGFPDASDNLPALPLERWGPLLFTSLDPAVPFNEWIAPARRDLEGYRFDPSRSRDYDVNANWALYCDNYLEGFHIPFVHGGLNAALDYGAYRTELHPHGNVQIGTAKDGAVAAHYWWLFPNLMLNFYDWGLSINVVKPLAIDRTRVTFLSYVKDESKLDTGAGAELDAVEKEDEEIVEAVQKGIQSRLYDRGRYSPTREQGVHQFHRMLVEALR